MNISIFCKLWKPKIPEEVICNYFEVLFDTNCDIIGEYLNLLKKAYTSMINEKPSFLLTWESQVTIEVCNL